MRNRVFRAALSVLLSCSIAVIPFRPAHAFVGVPQLALYAGSTLLPWTIAAISAAVAAGTAITHFLLSDSSSSAESMKMHVSPTSTATVPAGWTGNGSAQPTPPATASSLPCYYVQDLQASSYCGATKAAACTATHSLSTVVNVSGVDKCRPDPSVGGADKVIATGTPQCPTGYTLSGSTCNLSNASIVPKPSDNLAEKRVAGGAITNEANDPDSSTKMQPQASTSNSMKFQDKGVTINVSVDAANAVTITKTVPNADGATSTRDTITFTPTATTGTTSTTIAAAKTEVVQGVGTTAADTTQTTGNTVSCINCATEATLQGIIANGLKTKPDEQESTWSTQRSAVTTAQAAADAVVSGLKSKGDAAVASGKGSDLGHGLGDLSLPTSKHSSTSFWDTYFPSPATCAVVALGGSGRFAGMSMDMCPVLNALRSVVEWGLYMLTGLVIYQSWFGRREERV